MNKTFKKILVCILAVVIIGAAYYKGVYTRVYNQSNTRDNTQIGTDIDHTTTKGLVTDMTDFRNRYSGTKSNFSAVQYIRNYFREAGLEPFYKDGYYQSFYAETLKNSWYYEFPVRGTVENVIGKIPGNDSSKALIISAHLDSFKSKGVLDNASGTAVLLKSALRLTQKLHAGEYPIDIVFAAFNAEESSLLGSKAFYEDAAQQYSEFYNINMDCVGAADKPLAVKNENADSNALYKDFLPFLDKHNIPTKDILYAVSKDGYVTGTSDHEVFQENGHAALILGEDNIVHIVHTKQDDEIDLLDFDELDRLSDAVVDFVTTVDGKVY